ncbi:unnamed protein product [Blepharisma stoltei]|uniref:Uncharacterized protein n=1 Tax=Blepharisma stoltei TaxID=1481888 RepID=A0AAU9K8E5_9CILI|nr:unnamed protein product [Blepharisma stoltei]
MGICMSKHSHRKVSVKARNNDQGPDLAKIRAELISRIHSLHSVKSECKQGIEICAIQKEKSKAIILKAKQEYINGKLKEIQDLIKLIDDSQDKPIKDKNMIASHALKLNETLDPILIENDIDEIISGRERKQYDEILQRSQIFNKDSLDIPSQVDQLFESSASLNEPNSGGVRRKYNRRTKSSGKLL